MDFQENMKVERGRIRCCAKIKTYDPVQLSETGAGQGRTGTACAEAGRL